VTRGEKNRDRTWWLGAGLVALTALGLRVVHVLAFHGAPLYGTLVQDSRYYHETALRILGGTGASSAGVSFMNPGYSHLIAAVYWLTGQSSVAVVWLQSFLGAFSAVALAWAARRLLASDSASLLSGLLYAVYAGAIFYDGLLLTPSIVNVLVIAGLVFLAAERPVPSGLCLAAAVPIRPNMAPLILALAPAWRGRGAALLFVGISLAALLPFGLYNGLAHGQWVPISANGGVNFWIGNNTRAEGVYHAAGFVTRVQADGEREGFLAEARRRTGDDRLDLAAADRFWLVEGIRDIGSRPSRWLRIEGRKLALFWNRYESKTNVGLAFAREFSPVLRRNPVGFGPLAVAGVMGLVLLGWERRRRACWILTSLIAVPLLTCLLFFVSGEYRHPASLALCMGAALTVSRLVVFVAAWVRTRSRPSLEGLGYAALVGALFVPLVYWGFPPLERTFHPRFDYSNHAKAMIVGEGRPTARDFRRAVALLEHAGETADVDPFLLEARLQVTGRAAVVLGDPEMANRFLDLVERVLSLDLRPDPAVLPARFFEQLQRTLDRGIEDLARHESLRRDPGLSHRLAPYGANRYRGSGTGHRPSSEQRP